MNSNERRLDHSQAEQRYREYRKIAHEVTQEEFPGTRISGVTYSDVLEADRWKSLASSGARSIRADWYWSKEYPHYLNRPNRFELTVKRGGVLCAICLGQLSKNGTNVRMNLIESTPVRPSPLQMRALPIISFAASVFADIVGADELWVIDPKPALEDLYKEEGFGYREVYHGPRMGQRRIL